MLLFSNFHSVISLMQEHDNVAVQLHAASVEELKEKVFLNTVF